MKLSQRIREYRKANDMTQTEFAAKLYVSKQTVSKWETEKGYPDISMYPLLSDILNVSIDELMEKPQVKKRKQRSGIVLLLIGIVFLVIILYLVNTYPTMKRQFVKEAEALIASKLPSVSSYEAISFENWSSYNNYFPERMIMFTFVEKKGLSSFYEKTIFSEEWNQEITTDMLNLFPQSVKPYALSGFPFIFINVENHSINMIPLAEGEYQFAYVCCDVDSHMLMIFYFKGVIMNEE